MGMLQQAKNSEEKAKKAMVDAARLADELRAEQDHTNTQSKAKRALETQLSELEQKFVTPTSSPFVEVALPRPSSRLASVSWRLSWEMCRPTLERTPRATRSLSVTLRSLPSRLRRTRKTRTG